jgi:hypothetical protein
MRLKPSTSKLLAQHTQRYAPRGKNSTVSLPANLSAI